MQIRLVAEDHLPGVRRVALSTGQPEEDSGADRRYVRHVRDRGHVLVALDEGGEVMGFGGSVTIAGASLLTDLFVDPGHHGEGIGRALLDALWPAPGRGARFTFSSRHPRAMPLYLRAGLAPSWPLLYLTGPVPVRSGVTMTAARVTPGEAAAAEADLTGTDRLADYRYWTAGSTGSGVLIHSGRDVVAAGALSGEMVRHLACPDPAHAAGAVIAATGEVDGSVANLCLPGPHPAVTQLLESGYRIEDYDIFMASEPDLIPVTAVLSPALA